MTETDSPPLLNILGPLVHSIIHNFSLFQDDHTQHVAQGQGHQERPRGQPPAGLGALRLWPLPGADDLAQPRGASLFRRLQVNCVLRNLVSS